MRLNVFIAQASTLSRRAADQAIQQGRVSVNGSVATIGQQVKADDTVMLDGKNLHASQATHTILLNKPAGYVCSRKGQGNRTIYELLPEDFANLNPIGRLDKDSSGLLLLTNDGKLAQQMSHPSFEKVKVYEVELSKALQPLHQQMISDFGINLEDGVSKLQLQNMGETRKAWEVSMHEGRNRQIRRTFEALGYSVVKLHRTKFGSFYLADLPSGKFITADLN
jgi:23S rRNA pseudouridine2605 synthase